MNQKQAKIMIDSYVASYNSFDIDGMLTYLHPSIVFRNIVNGQANLSIEGIAEFRKLAEKAKSFFSMRQQSITRYQFFKDSAEIDIDYKGVLAMDLPSGQKAHDQIHLKGKTIFKFQDGKIISLEDYHS